MKAQKVPKIVVVLSIFSGLLCINAFAEVRLLTGDSNNEVHQRSGDLKDLSADGNLVLFTTLPPTTGSTPGVTEGGLYLRNISADTLEFVSDTTVSDPGVSGAEMSDDGSYLTWASTTPREIYWRDRTGNITRNVTDGATGIHGDPRMSSDGRYVAFISGSRDLIVDTSKLPNENRGALYVYDSLTDTVSIASLAPDGGRLTGVGTGAATLTQFDISGDGRFVAYSTEDPNAHPDKADMSAAFFCVCRRNLSTGEVVLVNRDDSGNVANGNFTSPRLNADGSRLVFNGTFVGFIDQKKMISSFPGSTQTDVYTKDIDSGEVWGLTPTTDGTAHGGSAGTEPVINDAGDVVAFPSPSDKLIPGSDSGGGHSGTIDIFRADLGSGGAVSLTLVTESPTDSGNVGFVDRPFLPGTGDYVAFGTNQLEEMGIPNADVAVGGHGIGVGTFPSMGSGSLSFTDWAMNLPSDMREPTDNPSGDGVNNAIKYFVGSDATIPDLSYLPEEGKASGDDLGITNDTQEYITLRIRIRRELPTGYTWSVTAAGNLSDLVSNPSPALQVGVPEADGDFDFYLFRFPTAINGDAGFMRLNVFVP